MSARDERPGPRTAASSPVRTVTTSGIESAAVASRETISACACGERSTAAWAVPGRSPMSSAKRPRAVSSAASSTRSTARPTRRGEVLGESGGVGMRSTIQGTIGEMVAGNGPGDSPGNDGSSLVRAPTRAAYSFADTDRAVIFPIRQDDGHGGDGGGLPRDREIEPAQTLATARQAHARRGRGRHRAGRAVHEHRARTQCATWRNRTPRESEDGKETPSRSAPITRTGARMLVAVERRGQNRVFPLAREGRLGFGPSAEPEPEGGLDGCTFVGHRIASVINPNALGIKH